jgi:protocatechuate 3,4-dioxygenase beta subunit
MLHDRRRFTFATAAMIGIPALVSAQSARRPTPAQTEGPFYPVRIPDDDDADLLQRRGQPRYTQGEPAWVEGTLTDLDGRPLVGAVIEIWQCDQAGHYHHPGDGGRADPAFQGFGRVSVDGEGRYRFRTIRPAPYTGRTPHIHFKVKLARRELLTTQLYVAGDPHNERDGLWRSLGAQRELVTVAFRPGPDGVVATFPIVIAV